MPLYKRTGSPYWWVKLSINGEEKYESTKTTDRKIAEAYEAKLRHEMHQAIMFGVKRKYLWMEAMHRYIEETKANKSHETDLYHFRWLFPHLKDKYLTDITSDVIRKLINIRVDEGVKPATVNRCMALLNRVLQKSHKEWDWLDKPPVVRKLKEPKQRVRFLMPEEANRLLRELPPHLHDMALFTLNTGLRMSEATGLQWSHVDLQRKTAWIVADNSKNGKARTIPLNEEAICVLRKWLFKHSQYVFTYKGQPIKRVNGRAFRNALQRANISDFRWHDLRHTWASWHIQNGTPIYVLKELGGWSDFEMVQRYAHLSSEHLQPFANTVSGLLKVS